MGFICHDLPWNVGNPPMSPEDPRSREQSVLIIGGGIGGLATAIGLQSVGFDVEVYEQTAEFREVGAGLTLWRNGLQALEHLGGHEDAVRVGEAIEHSKMTTPDGRVLNTFETQRVLPTDSPMPAGIGIHRADLQQLLRGRVDDGVIHLDHECVAVADHGDRVTARFSSGKEVSGDVIIGADGIHSVVRRELHGDEEPRFSGVGIWRAVTEFDHPIAASKTLSQALGSGQRFGTLPLGDGRVYWLVTERVPRGLQRPAPDSKDKLEEAFANWHEPIPALIESTPAEVLLWDEAEDRELLDQWGQGRITLLGDAAHLALPFAAQGASQALEDAVWLARYLDQQSDPLAALRAYETHRKERTEMIVRAGRRLGRLWNLKNPFAVAVRNFVLKYGPSRLMEAPFRRTITTEM